jgi:hypothetical protein
MKSTIIYYAALCVAAASASPIEKREDSSVVASTEWRVSDFRARCASRNGGCSWSFQLSQAPFDTKYGCSGSYGGVSTIPAQIGFQKCRDMDITWQFQKRPTPSGDYRILFSDIADQEDSVYGQKWFSEGDFPVYNGGQVYTGPTSFSVPRRP